MAILTDMQIDSAGDLVIADNDFAFVTGQSAMAQRIVITLKTILGEYQLDTSVGIPYFPRTDGASIFGKNTSPADREALIKDAIMGIAGVTALLSFNLAFDGATRESTITFSVATDEGVIQEQIVL